MKSYFMLRFLRDAPSPGFSIDAWQRQSISKQHAEILIVPLRDAHRSGDRRRFAPPGGSGRTLALTISSKAELHAHVAPYGPRWPLVTWGDLPAISTLVKVEIAARSCMCCEAT